MKRDAPTCVGGNGKFASKPYLLTMIIFVRRYKIMFLLKLLLGSHGQDLEGGGNVTGKPSNYPPRGLRSSGYGSRKDV